MTPRSEFRRHFVALFAILGALILSPTITLASDLVFGPVTCQRGTGAPTVFEYSFSAASHSRGYIFQVFNGGLEDTTYEQVSSSIIKLNGTEILGPSNFGQNVAYLEVPVTLQAQNILNVEVRGKPGGWPDLLLYNSDDYFFAEVKSSKDKLRQDQKSWIQGNTRELLLPFRLVKIHRMSG